MCSDHELLHHDEDGFVVYCNGCKRFQLAFGNLLCSLDEAEFGQFCTWVEHEAERCRFDEEPNHKSVCLPTPLRQWRMVFSPSELQRFDALLEQSRLIFQAKQLLLIS